MFRKKLIAGIMALTLCFSMGACGRQHRRRYTGAHRRAGETTEAAGPVEGRPMRITQRSEKEKLIVGITDFEPMDYKDDAGNWIGFDADMAKAFAESLGVKAEFVEIEWDNKILELNTGKIDCVWNGMTLTEEVTSAMDCSLPYCNNAQIVIVPADKADQYQNVESLKDLKFAVEAGSAGEAEAKQTALSILRLQDQANALMEVAAGTSDAAIIDSLMAAAMVGEGTSYDKLTYTVGLNSEEYGVGFRKGSDLVRELNEFFAKAMQTDPMQK